MNKEFLLRLSQTYRGTEVKTDVFNRRQATPREVAEQLEKSKEGKSEQRSPYHRRTGRPGR